MRLAALLFLSLATAATAEVPRVVVDFGPVQSLVADVMGDLGQPEVLLPAGADPHDFQLRPSQARALQEADVVFWIGPVFLPSLAEALETLAPEAEQVALLTDGGGRSRAFEDGGEDPHAWLGPGNATAWLDRIAEALAAHDPENAATYEANAAAAVAGITALDAEIATLLAPVKDRPFITYHDAFGYFTDHYGLALAGAIELGDASAPSAAQLAEIRGILTASKATCVFPETGRDPKFVASLSEGLEVQLGAALDLEFLELPAGRGQYPVLLRNIAEGIADCLSRT